MKCFRRYFCVLLCLVLLFGSFSLVAKADAVAVPSYHVYSTASINNVYSELLFYVGDGEITSKTESKMLSTKYTSFKVSHDHTFATDDKSLLFYGGKSYTVRIENLSNYVVIEEPLGDFNTLRSQYKPMVYIKYIDGSTEAIEPVDYDRSSDSYNLNFSFSPSLDVVSILVHTEFYFVDDDDYGTETYYFVYSHLGETRGLDTDYKLSIQEEDPNTGLLEGILQWIKGMFEKLGNILTAILELPQKIWEFIENGLKSLFVPSEEDMVAYKDKWNDLLADRLGVVWQVIDITLGSWDSISSSDLTNSITLPVTTIPLSNDIEFSFGGYDVQVVPSGFESIAEICKMACGAFGTLMFINGMRKRYDEVMGVEK